MNLHYVYGFNEIYFEISHYNFDLPISDQTFMRVLYLIHLLPPRLFDFFTSSSPTTFWLIYSSFHHHCLAFTPPLPINLTLISALTIFLKNFPLLFFPLPPYFHSSSSSHHHFLTLSAPLTTYILTHSSPSFPSQHILTPSVLLCNSCNFVISCDKISQSLCSDNLKWKNQRFFNLFIFFFS